MRAWIWILDDDLLLFLHASKHVRLVMDTLGAYQEDSL